MVWNRHHTPHDLIQVWNRLASWPRHPRYDQWLHKQVQYYPNDHTPIASSSHVFTNPEFAKLDFWPRFYIVVLGITFFPTLLLSIFYLHFYIPFIFFGLSFPFAIWIFFSSISVQFQFFFFSYRRHILDFFQFFFMKFAACCFDLF